MDLSSSSQLILASSLTHTSSGGARACALGFPHPFLATFLRLGPPALFHRPQIVDL